MIKNTFLIQKIIYFIDKYKENIYGYAYGYLISSGILLIPFIIFYIFPDLNFLQRSNFQEVHIPDNTFFQVEKNTRYPYVYFTFNNKKYMGLCTLQRDEVDNICYDHLSTNQFIGKNVIFLSTRKVRYKSGSYIEGKIIYGEFSTKDGQLFKTNVNQADLKNYQKSQKSIDFLIFTLFYGAWIISIICLFLLVFMNFLKKRGILSYGKK